MDDLTRGSVSWHLARTSALMLVTILFQMLYLVVDLYWVSRLGKEAIAAVGLAGNAQLVVLAASQVVSIGTTSLIARAVGNRDTARAQLVFNQSNTLSLAIGAAFLGLAAALKHQYVTFLAPDRDTMALAVIYLFWFVPALALQFGAVAMLCALRALGRMGHGTMIQSASVVLNVVLAPVLMFGWATGVPLGVAGAGIATLVSVVFTLVWLSALFIARTSPLRFSFSEMRPQLSLWRQFFGMGLPVAAEYGLMSAYLLVIYGLAAPFGAAAQAGMGIGMRVTQVVLVPISAIGMALTPVAGQNLGAGLVSRVKRALWSAFAMGTASAFVAAVLCGLASRTLVFVFSQDARVVDAAEEYLRIMSLTFVASGLIFVASSMLQALGNTWPSLLSSTVRFTLIVVAALALAQLPAFQLRWVWYLVQGAVVVQAILLLILLRGEMRRKLASA